MEVVMDWNRVEANWKQVKGKVKEKWIWGPLVPRARAGPALTAVSGGLDGLSQLENAA
jgi:hypothetical protein